MGCGQSKGMTIEVPSVSKVMEDSVMAGTCQAVSIVKSESRQENITTQRDIVEVVSIKSESGQEIDTGTEWLRTGVPAQTELCNFQLYNLSMMVRDPAVSIVFITGCH